MGVFKDMLGSSESLFKNAIALDYDYLPKLIPYREKEQFKMARCIKPLLQGQNGRNLIIFGKPGVGKTVACRHVLNELEEESEEVIPIYVNCWQRNTTHKVVLEICDLVGIKFIQNKKTEELIDEIAKRLNKGSAIFVFDEIDKAEDFNFLYAFLENIYKKSIFLITNYKEWAAGLDERIKSRLTAELTEFLPYNLNETKGILRERVQIGLSPNVLDDAAFELIVQKAAELQDIRSGLYLVRESANIAEDHGARKITEDHAKQAVQKLAEFTTKKKEDLEDDIQKIVEIIKANSGKRIGDIYRQYQLNGGAAIYKTFQRKVMSLEKNKFITVTKQIGGSEGSTSILTYGDPSAKEMRKVEKPKTLDDF